MSRRYYIGLATSLHDPAIAIIDDNGQVVFAEASERYYQVKRSIGCPPDNVVYAEELIKNYCAPDAEFVIAKSWSRKNVRQIMRLHLSGLFSFDLNRYIKKKLLNVTGLFPFEFNAIAFTIRNNISVRTNSGTGFEKIIHDLSNSDNVKNIGYDHHLSHAGLACYGSPFNDAICLIADGSGESGSFSIFKYGNGKITLLEKQEGIVSMGVIYAGLTFICGFDPMKGEEWKIMGLAAYGSFNKEVYNLCSILRVDGCTVKYAMKMSDMRKAYSQIQAQLLADPDNFSLKADIAYNGQLVHSQIMNELISNIHKKYPSDNIILTGGCGLNSSHNGEILNNTPFKNLYVPSAPADDGCALGSALLAYYEDHPHTESIHKNISPYLGTEINDEHIQHFLKFSGYGKVRRLSVDKYETVARLLADGKIIGWVQGRAEYGPRALGNRSILADPRRKEMKDIINERVKFREEFRPFAPSILHEHGDEYFEHYQESHYMERTLTFKKEAIEKVPGVVHVNNTGRLQTVKEEWNVELYHLIKAFHGITGVPLLLNTSFNIMGKPIIHTIEDALSTFFTTGIDALVINDYLIEK